jgi:hypothetical protein
MTPKKKNQNCFFHHSLAKSFLLKYIQENLRIFQFSAYNEQKITKNWLTKSYPYGNASREKNDKAARLKMFESIDKSLSEI